MCDWLMQALGRYSIALTESCRMLQHCLLHRGRQFWCGHICMQKFVGNATCHLPELTCGHPIALWAGTLMRSHLHAKVVGSTAWCLPEFTGGHPQLQKTLPDVVRVFQEENSQPTWSLARRVWHLWSPNFNVVWPQCLAEPSKKTAILAPATEKRCLATLRQGVRGFRWMLKLLGRWLFFLRTRYYYSQHIYMHPLVIQHSHGKWPIYRWFSHKNFHL